MIHTCKICTNGGIRLGDHMYFAWPMNVFIGERVQVDDLDAQEPEEVAIRLYGDTRVFYASRSDYVLRTGKGSFERALRHRKPFSRDDVIAAQASALIAADGSEC